MTKLRAVVIGCGAVGSLYDEGRQDLDPYSHAGAYKANSATELVAGADINPERRKSFELMWKVKTYENYLSMLTQEKADIVSVCTWPDSHVKIIQASINCGARLIFCEKPLSDSVPDARKALEACKARKVILAVNHLRRWDTAHQQIRDFINAGNLGEVQHVTVHYSGHISNTGSHIVDLLRFFFGAIHWIRAFKHLNSSGSEEMLDAYIMMRNGVTCTIAGCVRKFYEVFDWDVLGTRGRLRIEDLGYRVQLWRVGMHSRFTNTHVLVETSPPFATPMRGVMLAAVDNLVRCLKENAVPLDSGVDGLVALETITALQHSAAHDGKRVYLSE
ncbi:Gfo/Idh/MocA family oxidoreductase [Candidatus Bathyarchaeota archaeon]|jgi:predicted dehydrogenase|nr:Gfo/Idh/MocA family oxidoreductase [Candidatus Bathyarchaeota archaeon]